MIKMGHIASLRESKCRLEGLDGQRDRRAWRKGGCFRPTFLALPAPLLGGPLSRLTLPHPQGGLWAWGGSEASGGRWEMAEWRSASFSLEAS